MSQTVYLALKSGKANRRWEDILGFSLDELATHIERQFVKGMSWSNIGAWHVDHIVPKAAFDYASEKDAGFRACWALTNLRPMWASDNLKKGSKRTHLI